MPPSRQNARGLWILGGALAVVAALGATGQDEGKNGNSPGAGATLRDRPLVERWKRDAADYRIVVQTTPETFPSLRTDSALDWTNPIRVDDGVVLFWVSDGRPDVVACFFRYKWQGHVGEAHEFH